MKLESAKDDPDIWITDLESLRVKMNNVNISSKMSNMDFIIHILTNLPEEYEVAVDALKEKMQDKSNLLSIKTVRSKLKARFNSLSIKQEKTKEEKAFTSYNKKQFKGNCQGCGEYGHKQVNCPKSKGGDASPSAKNTRWRGPPKPFTCNYCKKPGHFIKDCPKLKKKNEKEKANLVTEKKVDDDKFF